MTAYLLKVKDNNDSLIAQMRQSIGIEIIRLRQLGTLADRREHIIEAHLIPDLRAELEPTEIDVATQAYGQEVVKRTMQQRAFLVVGKVVTYTHTPLSDGGYGHKLRLY